jgi:hypothetical protein
VARGCAPFITLEGVMGVYDGFSDLLAMGIYSKRTSDQLLALTIGAKR